MHTDKHRFEPDFLDFKLELKDHLACETEEIMSQKAVTFEEAFGIVERKWKTELITKKSWIISNEREFPKMVILQLKSKIVFRYLTVVILALIATLVFHTLEKENLILNDYFRYSVCFFTIIHFF